MLSNESLQYELNEYETFHDKIDNVLSLVNFGLMLFGIFANLICIGIFAKKPLLAKKFNWYLLVLAVADLLFCLIVFVNYFIYATTSPRKAIYELNLFTCYLTDYIVNSTDAFCVYLTLIVSFDRLYAIRYPIESRAFITSRSPKRLILVACLFILIIKSPEFFLNQRQYKDSNVGVISSEPIRREDNSLNFSRTYLTELLANHTNTTHVSEQRNSLIDVFFFFFSKKKINQLIDLYIFLFSMTITIL
jgi:hypothetical protein